VPEDRPAIGIFQALLDEEVVFAVAVAVDAAVDGPFAIELLEGGRYVEVTHVGAHAELPLADHAVHDWLASRSLGCDADRTTQAPRQPSSPSTRVGGFARRTPAQAAFGLG